MPDVTPLFTKRDPVTGAVLFDFSGHIHATGLDLDAGIVTAADVNMIRWINQNNGQRAAQIWATRGAGDSWLKAQAVRAGGVNEQGAAVLESTPTTDPTVNGDVWIGAFKEGAGAVDGNANNFVQAGVGSHQRHVIRGDGSSDYIQQSGTRGTIDYGPFTTGLNLLPVGGDVFVDVPVPAAVLAAAGGSQRVVIGSIEGTGGAYEYVTWGAQVSVAVAGNIRLWFKVNHPTAGANFYFNFWVRV